MVSIRLMLGILLWFWVLFVALSGATVVALRARSEGRSLFGWGAAAAVSTVAAYFGANVAGSAIALELDDPPFVLGSLGVFVSFVVPIAFGVALARLGPSLSWFRRRRMPVHRMADQSHAGSVGTLVVDHTGLTLQCAADVERISFDRVSDVRVEGETFVIDYEIPERGRSRIWLQPHGGPDSRESRSRACVWAVQSIRGWSNL